MSNVNESRLRIVIADDHEVVRYTIKLIIQSLYDVVGEAEDGGTAVALAVELQPDVVILDISMPVMTGFEASRLIRERLPEVRIIIVSSFANPAHIKEAFRSGANGYVVKGSAVTQLPQAIEDTLNDWFGAHDFSTVSMSG